MYQILDALRYTLPSVIVFLTAYFLLKEYFHHESQKRQSERINEKIRISLPLRLQAYERIILFLERISPQNLIMREHRGDLSAQEFQQQLVHSIREEYSHNLSQQLYISITAWEMVKNAREEIVMQINTAASQLHENATARDLSNILLSMSVEKLATRKALDFLKEEARRNF
jgi:hypothetical protein